MKKSSLFLAMLLLTPALYAREGSSLLTREQVIDVFARFNPTVLEKAKQNEAYGRVWEQFLEAYQAEDTPGNRFELIAVARNFDNSIRLHSLTQTYRNSWLAAKMSGTDNTVPRQLFEKDVTDLMTQVWAATVQLRKYQLQEAKAQLKALRKNTALAPEDKAAQEAALISTIKNLKAEIKSLQKNAADQITAAAQHYVSSKEASFLEEDFAVSNKSARQSASQARQTANLQIKSKNKKPVAK